MTVDRAAVDRAAGSATAPQSRHLTFKPCRRLPGRRGLGGRLHKLNHEPIGALAFALEICAVAGRACFEPRDLRLQCLELCRQQRKGARLATASWPSRIPLPTDVATA